MKEWVHAGRITGMVREHAYKKIKEGMKILSFVELIEKKILDNGASMAFPPNISINEYAAHDTASHDDKRVFTKGMVVKVDIGAQIMGAIGDTAFTIEIGTEKHEELISASREALNNALGIIQPGTRIRDIGKTIETTIKSHGYNPIINLGGHGLEKYKQHSGLFIPNYDNGNTNTLKKGQTIAIEPFATTGRGFVGNANTVKIYNLVKTGAVRSPGAKKILKFVKDNYKTLPFAKRWLYKKFTNAEIMIGLRELVGKKIIHAYPLLREQTKGIVSQHEHTLIVDDEPIITTKI